MANLHDIRLRMNTITQTLKVTSAMNLISTAKLQKGRNALANTEPFFKRIQKTMAELLHSVGTVESPFFAANKTGRTAIVAITSDKGLAGGYNASIYHYVIDICKNISNPLLILVGSIGPHYFANSPYTVLENFSFASQFPTLEEASEISDYVVSQFEWGAFGEVRIVYTHMYNALKLLPAEIMVLPFNEEKLRLSLSGTELSKTFEKKPLNFEHIPSPEAITDALAPHYVRGLFYGCLVEAYASEQSARMSAMDEASRNARDILGKQRISYNHARQAGITQEVTEIVSGAAALTDAS
ncbi:MAG: ATP synthase F1 subunit gamma [Spirochaetaceae bacterium]|jgi:F-type H+-transporting ATPase subunit gamma|nr:ATP synthase F1 subunit gamma [Spirochaetaceae bacterium]